MLTLFPFLCLFLSADSLNVKILVVAATSFEISPFLEKLVPVKKTENRMTQYRLKSVSIDLIVPGIGMMVTAFELGRQFSKEKYDIAISAGICGSFIHKIRIGDVVEVVEDCISDLGAEERDRFLSVFDLGLLDPHSVPYINGVLINNSKMESTILGRLPKVKGATVNTIPGRSQSIENSGILYSPEIETMEGAAFLYSCLMEGIPCAQIRAVSNYVEERDKSKWDVELAVKNLNRVLVDFVEEQVRE
jgi:futalosine hydrolase